MTYQNTYIFLVVILVSYLPFVSILVYLVNVLSLVLSEWHCIFLAGNGGCDPDGINTCPFGGICLATNEGLGRCHCEDTCPYVVNPVCGSDGKSYENDCLLKVAGCKRRSPIGIQHPGECGKLQFQGYIECCPKWQFLFSTEVQIGTLVSKKISAATWLGFSGFRYTTKGSQQHAILQ